MSCRVTGFCAFAFFVQSVLFSAHAAEFTPQLTLYGHPDFQGNWTTETATPFERPEELGDKKSYTVAEAQEWERDKNTEFDAREAPGNGCRSTTKLNKQERTEQAKGQILFVK